MKTSSSSVCKAGLGFTGLILLSVAVGAGWARAETFRHGGSAVTIEQSGGGTSRSKVIRYKDGQKIVTQDGNSTDITIQGGSGSLTPDYGWRFSEWSDERFDRQRIEERFSRDADDYSRFTVSREREAFKQRMFERMGSRFSP